MANPQKENGFTPIANEILEALTRINLWPYETRVLWFIIRKTYGFGKKADRISLGQIAKATGLNKGSCSKALTRLKEMNIISGNSAIGFQKDYEQWDRSPRRAWGVACKQPLSVKQPPVIGKATPPDTPGVIGKATTKERVLKKLLQKKDHAPPDKRVTEISLALEEIRKYKSPAYAKEAAAIKWMLGQGYAQEDILGCYRALKAQPFWKDKAVDMVRVKAEIGEWKRKGVTSGPRTGWEDNA